MKFGLHVHSFVPSSGSIIDIYPELRESVLWAESKGFTYFSIQDHLRQFARIGPADDPLLEAWVTLGALANATHQINLTTLVTCISYRRVDLLAHMVATIGQISRNRLILGLGAGGVQDEYESNGYLLDTFKNRVSLLANAVERMPFLLANDPTSPDYQSERAGSSIPYAWNKQRPRVLIGGRSKNSIIPLVARKADLSNFVMPSPQGFAQTLTHLKYECDMLGRNINTIEKTILERVVIGASQNEIAGKWDDSQRMEGGSYSGLIGTPSRVRDIICRYQDAGVDTIFVFTQPHDKESLALFAENVMPYFN